MKKNSLNSVENLPKNAGEFLLRIFSNENNQIGLTKDQILELNNLFKNILKLRQEDQLSLPFLAKSLFGDKIHNKNDQSSKTAAL